MENDKSRLGSCPSGSSGEKIMAAYVSLAEMLAGLIGPHCEVVLHAVDNHSASVCNIINGHHTGRAVGAPITNVGLNKLQLYNRTGVNNTLGYFSRNKSGELFKSATSVLVGEDGKAIGLFCVNINLSVPYHQVLQSALPDDEASIPFSEHFSASVHEVVMEATEKAIDSVQNDITITRKFKNKEIINYLYRNGIFGMKDAVKVVAARLGLTHTAIYKYLRDLKALSA
ncbi:MAG TPA: PAS domain-containing protein [Enterobacteriaceae bacterium]|nr:PAS domain-containing protein [Enterobacteriaceae bacterium]